MSIISSYPQSDPFSRAASYGDGVFETVRCVNGSMPLWPLHYQRLCRGLTRLQIDIPAIEELDAAIGKLLNTAATGVLKLMVFRAGPASGYTTQRHDYAWQMRFTETETAEPAEPMVVSVANMRLAPQPMLAGIKHLNRLEQVMAALELPKHDSDELILCDVMDCVIESIFSNLLMVKDNSLITPDTALCGVEGVGLNWLREQLPVETQAITLQELSEVEAIILMNSVRGPRLVAEVKGVKSYGQSHPLQAKMKRLWDQLFT